MKKTPKIILTLIAISTLFGLMALSKPAAVSAAVSVKDCKQWHTVQRGEYLSQIAKTYGTNFWTIADINDLANPNVIYPGQQLCVSLVSGGTPIVPTTSNTANVYAASVVEDKSVTLQGRNLAASTRHTVYMSNAKANYAPLIVVGVVTSDKNGAFKVTYNIPKKLIDVSKVNVTIVSTLGKRYSNWFYNATLEGNTGGVSAAAITIAVDSSKINKWVKIKVSNLPVKMVFDVIIGKEGSKGINGVKVGTISVSKTGSIVASFDIPSQYVDRAKLDIRLENKPYGIESHLTFANKNK